MNKEKVKGKILQNVAMLNIPQQRTVYSYTYLLLQITRKKIGASDLPKDRPAPGQIVRVMAELLEKADRRHLVCIQKFVKDVGRNFRVG